MACLCIRNELNGTIPSELRLMTAMTMLSMYGNKLSGTIPSELGLMTAMTRLSMNQMN
jgi:Leucine-rich repeat (LRR) protein